MSEHTPGPWEVYEGKPEEMEILILAEGGDIGAVWWSLTTGPQPVDEANARLIAAAPDLLEALECIRSEVPLDIAQAVKVERAYRKATEGAS